MLHTPLPIPTHIYLHTQYLQLYTFSITRIPTHMHEHRTPTYNHIHPYLHTRQRYGNTVMPTDVRTPLHPHTYNLLSMPSTYLWWWLVYIKPHHVQATHPCISPSHLITSTHIHTPTCVLVHEFMYVYPLSHRNTPIHILTYQRP